MTSTHSTDIAIIGTGIAGICCALEIMDSDQKSGKNTQILMIDRDIEANLGGLAKESFGGIFAVDTPHQRKAGVKDSPELALKDWISFGELNQGDVEKKAWMRAWAEDYVNNCKTHVYDWVMERGVKFLSMPLWVERGLDGGGSQVEVGGGNSVPRWHIVWGTGSGLIEALVKQLKNHPKAANITFLYEHAITALLQNEAGEVVGCSGEQVDRSGDIQEGNPTFSVQAKKTVIASGGINGSIDMVRAHWDSEWNAPPKTILNGAHKYADGTLHKATESIGGNLTNLERMWNYAAGVHHWKPRKPNHGLSLVPPKSALWLNAKGERIMPALVTSYDTRDLVTQITHQPEGYSWQVLNRKIALKEFAISGAEFNHAFREKSYFKVLKQMLFGDRKLVDEVIEQCVDVVSADTLPELVEKMNQLPPPNGETSKVDMKALTDAVTQYDKAIEQGKPYQDEQLQRILKAREWIGDRLRTCNLQKISDPKAGPFIAMREFIVSRKSLGGIQTNLDAQVLSSDAKPIANLYAIGEAAGFGGGGMNGKRALEGTFLGGCIYSGRVAGKVLAN